MKWILLLALITSCSTKKSPEVTQGSNVTESDAKPVSPYTVEPCFCMKIFQPVCAKGQTYGNSCEAECHGHKTWTEGGCSTKKK